MTRGSWVVFLLQCAHGGLIIHTCHASRITHHASRITHHASRITHHASRITHHASRITHHASRITHHASRITHHASQSNGLLPPVQQQRHCRACQSIHFPQRSEALEKKEG